MIKQTLKRTLALFLAVLMLSTGSMVIVSASDSSLKQDNSYKAMREILDAQTYGEYAEENKDVPKAAESIRIDAEDYITEKYGEEEEILTDAEVEKATYEGIECILTPNSGRISWKVEVPETAKYSVVLHVYTASGKATSIERIFRVNGKIPFAEARYITITRKWVSVYDEAFADSDRKFKVDIDGNELRPSMEEDCEWKDYVLCDANGFYTESFEIVFNKGENIISLEATSEPLAIEYIELVPCETAISYEEYAAQNAGKSAGTDYIKLEAEYPSAVSSQTIYPIEDRTDSLNSPIDPSKTMLNALGGSKWQTAGQWVRYKFEITNAGMYQIVPRFQQSILDGMFTSRSFKIKGGQYSDWTLPFAEAACLRFEYNRNSWQASPLHFVDEEGNTHNIELYLEPGTYEIEFEVVLGDMGSLISEVETTLNNINNAYLKIIKLTGADPDDYRDYGFARIMPDVLRTLVDEAKNLERYADELEKVSDEKSSNIAVLEQVAWLLNRMGRDEEEIAKNLDQMKSYIGTLGTFLSDAKTQPLKFDYIVVQGVGNELPKAKSNFLQSFWHEMKSFFWSFFRNYNRMGATEEVSEADSVEVWLAYGRDQSQVIRNLINNDFTPQTGIPVNLKLVTGGTLLPSILAGMGPDSYIGIGQGDVINYAIRGAILPIEDFEGFDEAIKPFNEAAMMVLGIADANGDYHTYGLPETQQFAMMFVRTDILADLEIDIPQTWDDLLAAVPILQANNMEIGMPASTNLFLYQMGGELFADEGMRINLDSNTALDAFEMMCNMFTMYSFPYTYDFANRFRTGEMPIGIANYRDTYNHLTVFATELKGRWQFVPLPGIEDAEGNINNCAVSAASAIVMIHGCKNEEAAWEFIKWHVGADCQIKYSNEMVAILGPSAKHHTANKDALESLPWTTTELENVMLQFNNLASIPNYPGSYIIDRYTKFAFLAAYNNKKNPVEELSSYITTINKEITRKREEFGLETLAIGDTLAKKRVRQYFEAVDALPENEKAQFAELSAMIADYQENATMDVDAVLEAAKAFETTYAEIYKLVSQAANAHATY